ncbi:MAG: gamma-glutamylcyclotransferase, partial [Alphaproteobacteria bacterium]
MTTRQKRTAVSSDNLVYDLDKSLPGIDIPTEDFWVFGYGSLIWNPGFDYIRATPTRIYNFQREFCLQSTRYRGTEAYFGLVLALAKSVHTGEPDTDLNTHCDGVAFLVSKDKAADTCAYLYEREMQHYSYLPTWISADFSLGDPNLKTDDKGQVLAFVIDPTKPTYHGNL